jgi:tyrosinase
MTRAHRDPVLFRGFAALPPFDGSRFPRLPRGGRAVAPSDIQTIAEWIDGGCPQSDQHLAAFDIPEKPVVISLARVTEPIAEPEQFSVHQAGPNEYMFERGELKQRMNFDCMNNTQIAK